MPKNTFEVNAETLNAMVSAMGALAACVAHVLDPDQRERMASAMSALARQAEASGDTTLETLLIDMHRVIHR